MRSARSAAHLGGMAAKVRSMLSRTFNVDRTPAWMYRSPISGVDFRASPQVPGFRRPIDRPGRREEERRVDGRRVHGELGKWRELGVRALEIDEVADRSPRMAEVSAALACRPFFSPENSATSSAVSPSQ